MAPTPENTARQSARIDTDRKCRHGMFPATLFRPMIVVVVANRCDQQDISIFYSF